RWYRAYDRVLDLSEGVLWAHWFGGGKLNIVDTCLDQWVRGPRAQPEKTALIWEGEPGEVRRLTFAELDLQVCRLGAALEKLGIERGDRVGVFLPMTREVPWTRGRDHVWEALLDGEPDHLPTHRLDPEHPVMVIYTSGTTGRPKGAVHVHGGFPLKAAQDMAWGFDLGRDDVIFWITDI